MNKPAQTNMPPDVEWGNPLTIEDGQGFAAFFDCLNASIRRMALSGGSSHSPQGTMWRARLVRKGLNVRYLDSPYGNDHYYVESDDDGVLYHCQSGNGKTVVFGFMRGWRWVGSVA